MNHSKQIKADQTLAVVYVLKNKDDEVMRCIPDLDVHYGKWLGWSNCNMKQMGLSRVASIARTAVLLFF